MGTYPIINSYQNELGDILNYFNTSSGIYTLQNTPNILLNITASLTNAGDGTSGTGTAYIEVLRNGVRTQLTSIVGFTTTGGSPTTITLSSSYYGLNQDQVYLRATSGISPTTFYTITNAQFLITQSVAPTASVQDPVILEPYITTANYDNSDYNPLINNAVNIRKSIIYQDIDYSQGALVPVNFNLLISGSAQKAEVQDSNYTLARHINPRYNGSKTTSQQINVWSTSDTNTYGKLPTVESNKTYIAYCDTIGGYSPDRMNSSAIVVKYLIDENGTVSIPNTSENSLANIQDTFLTGEKLIINTDSIGSGVNNYRNIIKGGYRIENLLYNQSGSMPGGSFLSTITLTDKNETGGVISDYQALLAPSTFYDIGGPYAEMKMSVIISSGSALPSYITNVPSVPTQHYTITAGMISEGLSITLNAALKITNNNGFQSTCYAQFRNNTTSTYVGVPIGVNTTGFINGLNQSNPLNISYTIPFSELVAGHEYSIMITSGHTQVYYLSTSRIQITQSPTPSSPISTVGLWVSGSSSLFKNLLYTTSSALITYFNTSNTFQQDIPNSGFEPITLPWGLKTGDEFRFEGREDRVWMVANAEIYPAILTFPSYLIVEMDKPLPTSGSVNFDQFSIRRYVDDASVIIFEGLKPGNAAGPYIVSPEFVTLPLKKNIDTFITDLTQKGLLP
jgi:hypothetical protein